jgi:hypothetical protein
MKRRLAKHQEDPALCQATIAAIVADLEQDHG